MNGEKYRVNQKSEVLMKIENETPNSAWEQEGYVYILHILKIKMNNKQLFTLIYSEFQNICESSDIFNPRLYVLINQDRRSLYWFAKIMQKIVKNGRSESILAIAFSFKS